jgi:glycosyl transferase family 25
LPVFIINLPHSRERRERIKSQLDKLKLPHRFIEAVAGAGLDLQNCPDYAGRKRRIFFGRDLTKGELGCLLSHRAIYSKMVADDIAAALILEDDSRLEDDLPEVLDALMALPLKWDIIRFLSKDKNYRQSRILGPLYNRYNLTRIIGTPGGAYGYVMTQAGAKKMLRHMKRNWIPVDILQGHVLRLGLETFGVTPSPVTHGPEEEDTIIGAARYSKNRDLTGWEKTIFPATRFVYKLFDLCQKKIPMAHDFLRDRYITKKLVRHSQKRIPL